MIDIRYERSMKVEVAISRNAMLGGSLGEVDVSRQWSGVLLLVLQ